LGWGPDGYPHIAYRVHRYPDDDAYLGYASKGPADWGLDDVDTSGFTGGSPSLALDQYGYAHVSYFDYAEQNLTYATNAPPCPVETALAKSDRRTGLRSMRRLRDEVLAESATGKDMTSVYYRHAPELTQILSSDISLKARTALMLWEFMPGIRGLLNGDSGVQMVLTERRAQRVQALVDDLAVRASPQLRVQLGVLSRIAGRHVGRTLQEIWLLEGGWGNPIGLVEREPVGDWPWPGK
jgi:hypothetical protein